MNSRYSFMEEYKCLDKLIIEAYNTEKGVSTYIEEMENHPEGCLSVSNWDFDLEQLKRLRHIRNRIAHEVGASEDYLCSSADTLWLEGFRNRMLHGGDPLSILRTKKKEVRVTRTVHHSEQEKPKAENVRHSSKKISSKIICAIALTSAILLVFILLVFVCYTIM